MGSGGLLPFAPEIVVPAVEYYRDHLDLCADNAYEFKATSIPRFPAAAEVPMVGSPATTTG
jgi:hypothetical protein